MIGGKLPDLSKMLSAAHEVKHLLDGIIMRANIQDSGEARVSATLCLTISEKFAAVLHLIEGGFSTHAPDVVRTMLEGMVSLRNLVNNPHYLDQMRFDDARSNITLFEEYAADPGMQEDAEAIAKLTDWRDAAKPIFDELRAKGFQKQSVFDKFKMADMLQNYVAYRFFSSFTHNQLTTLIARHAGKFELRYHDDPPIETTASIIAVSLSAFCQAVATLSKFTDIPDGELTQAINRADAIWALGQA